MDYIILYCIVLTVINVLTAFVNLTTMTLYLHRRKSLPFTISAFVLFTVSLLVLGRFTDAISNMQFMKGVLYLPLVIVLFEDHLF